MKVKITAYKNHIIIDASEMPQEKNDNWIPIGDGRIGCVVHESLFEMSNEAFELLKQVRASQDAIGDVMCWKDEEKGIYFGWLGGFKRIGNILEIESDRYFNIQDINNFVENEIPQGAKEIIDNK